MKQNKKREYLISLGAGKSQIPLIKSAKNKGYYVITIDKNKKAPGKKYSEIFLNLSTHNFNNIKKKIKKLNKNVIGVINRSSGYSVITAAKLQKFLCLKYSDPKKLNLILDKKKFVNHCLKFKIPVPLELKKKKSIYKKFPVVVKPAVSNFGKQGISIVKNKSYLDKSIKIAKKYSKNKLYIIQQFVKGSDIVFMGVVKNKKVVELTFISEINKIKKNLVTRNAFKNPVSNLSNNMKKKVFKITNKLIKIFNLDNTPINISFRISGIKLYLIEINLEISGELIHEKLIKFKKKNYNSFDWYLDNLFLNNKVNKYKFLRKEIKISDKLLGISSEI